MTLEVAPANHGGPSYPPLVLSTDLGGVLNNTVGGETWRAGLVGDACALSFRGGLASRERSAPGRPQICRCFPVGRPATADGRRYWPGGYRGGLTCVATRALSPSTRVVSQGCHGGDEATEAAEATGQETGREANETAGVPVETAGQGRRLRRWRGWTYGSFALATHVAGVSRGRMNPKPSEPPRTAYGFCTGLRIKQ